MVWSLLYLHGVGQGVRSDEWFEALSASLEAQGVDPPPFSSSRIIRPSYVDLLKNPPGRDVDEPGRTGKEPGDESERRERRARYSRRQANAVTDLPGTTDSTGLNGVGENIDVSSWPWLPGDLPDAREYLSNKRLRSAVLHRVLDTVGKHRDLIVIGHSLGSMVAVDLLAHLPTHIRIRRVVTLGSPLGALGMLKKRPEILLRNFPYHRVEGWVNLLSPYDIVTYGRGISPRFPAAIDVRINIPFGRHSATHYLAHPAVAKVIAQPLRSPQRLPVRSGYLAVPLTRDEQDVLDTLRFGRLVNELIASSSKQSRYDGALRAVQQEVAATLQAVRRDQARPAAYELDLLAEGGELDLKFGSRTLDAQLLFAVLCATNNPVAPFDLETKSEHLRAVVDLWRLGFGHSKQDGEKVAAAIKAARDAFDDNWNKLLLGGLGLAVLAAGPVGLIAAAPAGLAGGAAITAALATFGPGGMVGGLALAGGLLSAGSGMLAAAVTPGAMSPDMIRTHSTRLMAFALAQRDLDIPGDRFVAWTCLNSWHSDLTSEHHRLALFSDEDSPTMKSVREKLKVVEKAVGWLVDRRLCPLLELTPPDES